MTVATTSQELAVGEMAWRVEEVRTLDRVRALARPWDDLCDRAIESCPTMRHAFLLGWLEAFGARLDLRLFLIWDGERLVCGAPFARRTEWLFGREHRVLGLVSNTWIDRSLPLLASDDTRIMHALFEHVRAAASEFDVLAFGPLDPTSRVASLIRTTARLHGWRVGEEAVLTSPFLALPPSWDDLLSQLSPAFRATLRRKIRHAEKLPSVNMRIVQDASCWDAVASISADTWQATEGTAMTSRPELSAFFDRVIRDAAARGTLCCGLLYVDDLPVAFDFNIIERGVLYSFKMGFRSSQAVLSAGLVLKAFVLRDAVSQGRATVHGYDFMGTAEEYKLHWTSEVRAYDRQFLFLPTAAGAATHWIFFVLRPWLRERTPRLWAALKRLGGGA